MSQMATLDELQDRRRDECRLTPNRALRSIEEAEAFLVDRGLLTRSADCSLPSLFEACHEDPYAPASPGFGQWPATKFPWFGELGARGYAILAIHNGKSLLVTPGVAALMDPICRSELERMERADPGWARLLQHLADAGPSELEDLRTELQLKAKELKALRSPLERCGAVVSRSLVYEDPHRHTSELARWDQVFQEASGDGGLEAVVEAGVRAAVVAREDELPRWFSWRWYWDDGLVDRLVEDARLERPAPGWVAVSG
jgi:hypothetical protein